MCLLNTERSIHERDSVAFKEVLFPVRGDVGMRRELAIAGNVDSVKGDLAVLRVAEGRTVYADAYGSHDDVVWQDVL